MLRTILTSLLLSLIVDGAALAAMQTQPLSTPGVV